MERLERVRLCWFVRGLLLLCLWLLRRCILHGRVCFRRLVARLRRIHTHKYRHRRGN